jgi:hypothetical protein
VKRAKNELLIVQVSDKRRMSVCVAEVWRWGLPYMDMYPDTRR